MTPTETAAILRQFNEWSRGDEDIPQFDPREIGEAIDAAVEMIERMDGALESLLIRCDDSDSTWPTPEVSRAALNPDAAMECDAARYRWLRDHAEASDWEMFGYQDIDHTDAAIDAAMGRRLYGERHEQRTSLRRANFPADDADH